MIIKTFESYIDRWKSRDYKNADDVLKSISSDWKWKLVEDPEKEYGIKRDIIYKHSIEFYDLLFSIKSSDDGKKKHTVLWIFNNKDKSAHYLDDPCNKFSYKNLYAPNISSWCIKAGEDFIKYLEWESQMPTEEEINECFQDLIDEGKSIEIFYGRGGDPKSLWELEDYFSVSSYREEKKILIRIRDINQSHVDEITKSCKLLNNFYGVDFKIFEFSGYLPTDFGVVCSIT